MIFEQPFREHLDNLAQRGRLREPRTFSGLDRAHPVGPDGQALLSFCSNDYLGLATSPALSDAVTASVTTDGFGSGSSRLVAGQAPAHQRLEHELAAFLQTEAALLFPTGYQANLGVLTALAGPEDLIASDAANHASIIDGCRLSRARVAIFDHCNAAGAARALMEPGPYRRRLLVTESLFSMDGDRAPLHALAQVARECHAALIVDEAHALGVLGPAGRGLCAQAAISPDVLVGTLGKAFGSMGGFVAGSLGLRAVLVNCARQFIYTTAPAPAFAAAACAALDIVAGTTGDRLRALVSARASRLRSKLTARGVRLPGEDHILPLVIGRDEDAVRLSSDLFDSSILIPAIRPPTVPEGTARLRVTVSASHTEDDIDTLADHLAKGLERLL